MSKEKNKELKVIDQKKAGVGSPETPSGDRMKDFSARLDAFYREDKLRLPNVPKGLEAMFVRATEKPQKIGAYIVAKDLAYNEHEHTGLTAPAVKEGAEDKVYVVKQLSQTQLADNNSRHQIPPEFEDTEDYLQTRKFLHPSVITPMDRVREGENNARVYEAGLGNLEDYLEGNKKMDVNQALSVMIRLGDGLVALHKKGVVHGDIAPLNMILFPKTVKLGDLDSASIDPSGQGKFNRKDNKLWGNRFILPPEMYKDSPTFDSSVDTYETAATLYRMLAGKWPYDAEGHTRELPYPQRMEAYRKMHAAGKIEFPSSMPVSLQRIIQQAMDPNPRKRPSMREFTTTLLDIKEKELPTSEQREFLKRQNSKTVIELEQSIDHRSHILERFRKAKKDTKGVEWEIQQLQKKLTAMRDQPAQEFGPGVFVFRQKELTSDSVPSETIKDNEKAKLDVYKEIRDYLDRQDPQYLEQLAILESQIPEPMQPQTEVVACIPVAGHQEVASIYNTIASYANQKADPKSFEVLLLVNFPQRLIGERSDDIRKTQEEIEKAKRDFPKLRLRVATTILPDDQVKIGNIRKIGTDLALLRQRRSKSHKDLVLLSNDADNEGLSENYVTNFVRHFTEHPEKDGAVGNLQFSPNGFIKFPTIQVKAEFATNLDQQGFKNGNVDLFGNNSAMKSSIYAAIGGYPTALKTGEQEWTGNTIRKLRKSKKTLGFVEDGLLLTSVRRLLITELKKLENQVAFGDHSAEAEMRALDLDSYPPFDFSKPEAVEDLRQKLEVIVNKTVGHYESGDKLGKNSWFYMTNLEKVGIKYKVEGDPKDPNSRIIITDMSKFIIRQQAMQKSIKSGEKNMVKVYEASLAT
jgi:serine/threonine protein kinase